MSNENKLMKELCWEDRLLHNKPEVRFDANIDLKVLCESVTDPKDPRICDLGHIFKKTVSDSHALVQDEALDALIAYLKAADADVAGRYAKEVCDAITATCLTGRPKTAEKAQMVFMLWLELEAVDAFLDAMEKAIKSQDAKAVVHAIDIIIQALSEFGPALVPTDRIANMLREILDHQDENVLASSKGLVLELCRWFSMDIIMWAFYPKMSDKMKQELDVELPSVKTDFHAPRTIRSEQKGSGFPGLSSNGHSEEPAAENVKRLQKMSLSDPHELNKKDVDDEDEINQLQNMSFSDPQEQNKMDIDGDNGYNNFQESLPAWYADDYFERLSSEELLAQVLPHQKWVKAHTCTRCGILYDDCSCKQQARLENTEDPHRFDHLYEDFTFYVPTHVL